MRLGNLILLIVGYGCGQGSILLAQTWLITRGQLGLVADFGVNFYVATLAIMLVDFGSIGVMARETAAAQYTQVLQPDPREPPQGGLWTEFWSVFPSRAAMAVAIIAAGAVAATLVGDEFSRAYALWAWPALIAWAFNATGMLDGLRLSGMNGLAGAFPFVLSGLCLALVADQTPSVAGAVLGAALSAGYILAMVGQMLALIGVGHAPRWVCPTRRAVLHSANAGFAALLSTLPGQLYFRLQILLAGLFLGEAGAALFLYAKQITTGFAQLIGFLRRIEFPDLVSRLKGPHGPILREVMAAQRLGTMIAAAASLLVFVVGVTVWLTVAGPMANAGRAVAWFAPTILTGAILLSLIQALTAQGRYRLTAIVMILSMLASAVICVILAFYHDLAGFAASDLIINIITIVIVTRLLNRSAVTKANAFKI